MSQLINVIGTENSNANRTAKTGKESLIKFKKQISQIHDEYDDDPDEDYMQFSQTLNRNSKKSVPISRSRTQSVKKRNNNTNKETKAESSRSRSNSRSCCRMKNATNQLRNSADMAKAKQSQKKADFLEELLDSEQPTRVATTAATSHATIPIRSVSSTVNESEQQPLLFDKYLVNQFCFN